MNGPTPRWKLSPAHPPMLPASIGQQALDDPEGAQVLAVWRLQDDSSLAEYLAIIMATDRPQAVTVEALGQPPVLVRLTMTGLWICPRCARVVAALCLLHPEGRRLVMAPRCVRCSGLRDGAVLRDLLGVVPDLITADIAVVQQFRNLVAQPVEPDTSGCLIELVRDRAPDAAPGGET